MAKDRSQQVALDEAKKQALALEQVERLLNHLRRLYEDVAKAAGKEKDEIDKAIKLTTQEMTFLKERYKLQVDLNKLLEKQAAIEKQIVDTQKRAAEAQAQADKKHADNLRTIADDVRSYNVAPPPSQSPRAILPPVPLATSGIPVTTSTAQITKGRIPLATSLPSIPLSQGMPSRITDSTPLVQTTPYAVGGERASAQRPESIAMPMAGISGPASSPYAVSGMSMGEYAATGANVMPASVLEANTAAGKKWADQKQLEKAAAHGMSQEVGSLLQNLEHQSKTYGMTEKQLTLYELKLKGATDAQLKLVEAAYKDIESKQSWIDKNQKLLGGLQQTAGVAGVAGSVITRQMSGGMQSAGEAMATFSQAASLIPGPIGAAASAVTGILGAAITAVNFRWEQMIGRVKDASGSVMSGSQTMSGALANVGISALTEEFNIISERMTRIAQTQRDMFGRTLSQQESAAIGGYTPGEDINAAIQRMEAAEQATRDLFGNRRFLDMQQNVALRRGTERGRQAVVGSELDTGQARAEVRALQAGQLPLEAQHFAARQRMQDEFIESIRREGETREQAAQRLRTSTDEEVVRRRRMFQNQMVDLQAQQREQRRAQADQNLARGTFDMGQQQRVMAMQTQDLRAQRGTLIQIVGLREQEQELNRMRLQGASDEQIMMRRNAIEAQRRLEMERNRAAFANEVINRNRTAAEDLVLQQRRLEDARGELGPEQFRREQGRLTQGLLQSQIPNLFRLSSAMTEGSAAGASAVFRAEREQQLADPRTALPAALNALREQQRQQADYNRRAAEAMEQNRDLMRDLARAAGGEIR